MKVIKIILTVFASLLLLSIPVWRIVCFGDLVEGIGSSVGFSKYSKLLLPLFLMIITIASFSKVKKWLFIKILALIVVVLYFIISAVAFIVSLS